jgi:hypothetical protein
MVPYSTEVSVREGESRTMQVTLQHESHGVSPVWWWIGSGLVAAAGVGVGGYFLLRPSQSTAASATQGTIYPGVLTVQPAH